MLWMTDRGSFSSQRVHQREGEEEKEAAHQKNRRTEMKVLTYDYVPKESQVPQTPVPQN